MASENRASTDAARIHGPLGLTNIVNDDVPKARTRHRDMTLEKQSHPSLSRQANASRGLPIIKIQRYTKVRYLDEVTHSALRGMTLSVANDNASNIMKNSANTLTATAGKVSTRKASFAGTKANKFSFVTEQLSTKSFANNNDSEIIVINKAI